MPHNRRSSQDEDDSDRDDMIAIQTSQQQALNAFNSRFSSIWSERTGNSALSQVNVQNASTVEQTSSTRYSCFQLSPMGPPSTYERFQPPPSSVNRMPPPQVPTTRPRLPTVVERALAPRVTPRTSINTSVTRRPERGGSPVIMERFLSENQEARESRTEQRRQQRSPPQQFEFVSPELIERAQSTRNLVGERFLRSLDQASILSPEVAMAIKMVNQSRGQSNPPRASSSRDRTGMRSPPVPATRKNFEVVDNRRPRERLNSVGESSSRSRGSRERESQSSRVDQTVPEPSRGNHRYRSSSVPGNTRTSLPDPPPAPIVDTFPTSLKRSETYTDKVPRSSSRHSSRRAEKAKASDAAPREVRFTEVRSLQEVDRPASVEPVMSLSSLQHAIPRAESRQQHETRIDEADGHSQVGWDGSQCSEDSRDGVKSPVDKLVGMFSNTVVTEREDNEEIIAIQDLHPRRTSLLTMLPQPLRVSRVPSSSSRHPKFQFERNDGQHHTLPKDLIASRGDHLHIITEGSNVSEHDATPGASADQGEQSDAK